MEKKFQEVLCRIQYFMASDFLKDLYESNINYAIIKGCPLAYYKTGNPGTRLSSDIDILVSRQDIQKVQEILNKNAFQRFYTPNRKEHILLMSNSHQLTAYGKTIGNITTQIDVNFDLFWGEYKGKRIEVSEFLEDSLELEIWGCKIRTLSPIKMLIQVILHHYKEMNSLYHLTGHISIKKRLFEDVYVLCKQYPEEISVQNLYNLGCKYEIIPYVFYMLYYTKKVYNDSLLDTYLKVFWTEEGEMLLEYYGLAANERRVWKIDFDKRLDTDVSELIYAEMTDRDKEKLERNRRIFG